MRNLLLIVHITAVAAWLGANFTQGVVGGRLIADEHLTAAAWMRSTLRMGQVLYPPAAVLILLSGIFLVLTSKGAYRFDSPFVAIGVAVVIAGAVLGSLVFGRLWKRAAELHEAGGSADLAAIHQRLTFWGILDTVLMLIALVAMVTRLGA
jgi:hypothetical protein